MTNISDNIQSLDFEIKENNVSNLQDENSENVDLIDKLVDAMLEAAKPNWNYNHYCKLHFCKIEHLKTLKKINDYKGSSVFLIRNHFRTKHEENWFFPVINVAICGTIIEARIYQNNFWCEVLDETGSILCVTDICKESQDSVNTDYCRYHRSFRNLESNLKTAGKLVTPVEDNSRRNEEEYSLAACLWLFARKKKQMLEENNDIQLKSDIEIKGSKIIIYGQLKENENKKKYRFIGIKKSKIVRCVSDELLFNEQIKNQHLFEVNNAMVNFP